MALMSDRTADVDAQALVRQLAAHPEVLDSMQHLIALLRENPSSTNASSPTNNSSSGSSFGGGSGGTVHHDNFEAPRNVSRVRPPRTGYASEDEATSGQLRNEWLRPHLNAVSNQTSVPSASSRRQEICPNRQVSSPTPSFALANPHETPSVLPSAAGQLPQHTSLRRATPRDPSFPDAAISVGTAQPQSTGEASMRTAAAQQQLLTEAQRRISELENELLRTTTRIDQLAEVVQRQKTELQATEDRHMLEMEEMRHSHEAAVQRKDEIQEETLRQLLKSRQLLVSAAKFEAVVAATQQRPSSRSDEDGLHGCAPLSRAGEKRHANSKGGSGGDGTGTAAPFTTSKGLTSHNTAVNTRTPPTLGGESISATYYTAGVKRERWTDDPYEETVGGGRERCEPAATRHSASKLRQAQPQQRWWTKKGLTPDSFEFSGSTAALRPRSADYQETPSAAKREVSPASLTTTAATPAGKASAVLVSDARTHSRSLRKRRTPRTPSLTNADRIAQSFAGRNVGAPPPLPGTASVKLDSPTPVVSATWTAGRSLTSSRTPPPPLTRAGVCTVEEAVGRRQQQQQRRDQIEQATKQGASHSQPPLTRRVAGRLPPAAPHATTTSNRVAVPNTLSGASSVASGGPTRSPSPVNPKRGAALPRYFLFTGLKDDEPQRLTSAIHAIGGDAVALASDLDEPPPSSTTHIVLRGTPRSVKALCGVVSGKWLVSPEYIYNSQQCGFWLDETEEGGLRIFPSPLKCQRFLLTVSHPSIREKLAQVIEYGGGEVMSGNGDSRSRSAGGVGTTAQDVIVISSGDDLLRYATQDRV